MVDLLYVTSKEKCFHLSLGISEDDLVVCTEMLELECNHEKADTRLLLHAMQHQPMIQSLIKKDIFFYDRNRKLFSVDILSRRYIAEAMDEKLSQCLPSFHAFSGRVSIQGTDFFFSQLSYLYGLAYAGVVS